MSYADDVESVLSDALALLSEIIDGDQLYDPGTEEEQESRDYLLSRHYEVRAEAARIGAIPADIHPLDPIEVDKRVDATVRRLTGRG